MLPDEPKELLEQEQETESSEESTEEEEQEESDTEESTETEGDEEPSDEPKDDDQPKVQKRINSLTAKLKGFEEENADLREEVDFLKQRVESAEARTKSEFPDPIVANGKPMYSLPDKEFNRIIKEVSRNPNANQAFIAEAIEERERYLEIQRPILQAKQKANEKASKLWVTEWAQIEKMLLDPKFGNPDLAKYVGKLNDRLNEEIQDETTLEMLQRSPKAKLKWVMRALKEEGIDIDAQIETYQKETPTLKAPVSAGKGKKTPLSAGGKPTFKASEIESWSLAEFKRRNKDGAIDKAWRDGRVIRT